MSVVQNPGMNPGRMFLFIIIVTHVFYLWYFIPVYYILLWFILTKQVQDIIRKPVGKLQIPADYKANKNTTFQKYKLIWFAENEIF